MEIHLASCEAGACTRGGWGPTTQGEDARMDQQIMFYLDIFKGGERKKKRLRPSPRSLHHKVAIFSGSNCVLVQSGGGAPGCGRRNLSDLGAKSRESGQNMRQNADPWIINIYIYLKPERIGFFRGRPLSVMYAFWLLIVTLPQSERRTVNTFEVNVSVGT